MTKLKSILVIGGVHGDEATGVSLARYFMKKNNPKIKGLIGNQKAVEENKRFLETDLNRSFSKKLPISLEEKIAIGLKRKLSGRIILDFHNTKAAGTTGTIVVQRPSKLQLFLTEYFGFKRIVRMPPSSSLIGEKSDSSISLEIANSNKKQFPVKGLRAKIIKLVDTDNFELKEPLAIKEFRYVGKVERKTIKRLGFKLSKIKNFKALTKRQKNQLGVPASRRLCPIFYKSRAKEKVSFTLVEEKSLR